MDNDSKQLFKFYGIEYNTKNCYDLDIYIMNLEHLADCQSKHIERIQQRLHKLEPKQSFLTQPIRQG